MYSPLLTDRRLHAAKKAGLRFQRLPRAESVEIAAKLELLRFKGGRLLPEGQLLRPLNRAEQDHIDSERLICKCDFSYWAQRYAHIEIDPGVGTGSTADEALIDKKIGPVPFLPSQERIITLIGRRELECQEEKRKHKFTEGIRAYIHKVRQICATQTCREMTWHRCLFWPGTRAFCASLDSPRVTELFRRDKIILNNLPWWQGLSLSADVKDTEVGLAHPNSSHCNYEAENAETGIGTGSQYDISCLTEISLWRYPGRIGFSFVPSIPKANTTLHVQESTANVKGDYWYEVTEAARHKRRGYENYVYAFIPWYMNMMKYRAVVPDAWTPEEHTIRHATLIERTSPEFFDGKTIEPTREQLYWWETNRAQYAQRDELAAFLASYPATPEQSFQHPSKGALPVELIEEMEQEVWTGMPYDVDVAA